MGTRARASPITREEVTMKNSIRVLPAIVFVLFFSFACSSSSKDTPIDSQKQVPARNVILNSSALLHRDQITTTSAAAAELDTETQVLAENVVVDTSANTLSSTNLQSVLDDEMAVDLSTLLPGTTWTVSNRDDDINSYATGSITFGDNTITVNSGDFGAAGYLSTSCPSNDDKNQIGYELINNSLIYFYWTYTDVHNNTIVRKSVMSVVSATKKSIILAGTGGCGIVGPTRVSILTKAD